MSASPLRANRIGIQLRLPGDQGTGARRRWPRGARTRRLRDLHDPESDEQPNADPVDEERSTFRPNWSRTSLDPAITGEIPTKAEIDVAMKALRAARPIRSGLPQMLMTSALLLKPGGFEGVGLVDRSPLPALPSPHETSTNGPNGPPPRRAALSPSSGCEENQDPIPLRRDELVGLPSTLVPGGQEGSMLGPIADRPRAAGRSGTSPAQTNSTSESRMSDVQKLPAPQLSYTALSASRFSSDIAHAVSRGVGEGASGRLTAQTTAGWVATRKRYALWGCSMPKSELIDCGLVHKMDFRI